MCGIVGAISERNVVPILLEGLKKLEYRGYDSAGIAVINKKGMHRLRVKGKVSALGNALKKTPVKGPIGIAHTRWATHGKPSKANAHPHVSRNTIAVVHNGIIENHDELRQQLQQDGYKFTSQTDTEVIAHLMHKQFLQTGDLKTAVRHTIKLLNGAYALAIINIKEPDHIIAVRSGSPLVVGLGIEENFLASDYLALLPVTQKFMYLEEGDLADISKEDVTIYSAANRKVKRKVHVYDGVHETATRGKFKHFMQKEIFEQPKAIANTLAERIGSDTVLNQIFGTNANTIFKKIQNIQIVACGTSYHAGLVARYWMEKYCGLQCQVEIASEIRYRKTVVKPDTLFVTISQSGETADTLAALRQAKTLGYKYTLAICNVPESSLVRESDLVFMTKAGPEIGVASTKAFTTQLTALLLLTIAIGKHHGMSADKEAHLVHQLHKLPRLIKKTLALDAAIEKLAEQFAEKHHAFFLGRGTQYPVAMEGALKLKEISYIHAESYPAGELKHGPLALIDKDTPVIVVAPNNKLLEKLISNIHEVRARGGKLYVFADKDINMPEEPDLTIIPMPIIPKAIAPIVYTVPLQLLAYHVAVLKGTDVDQPRNLAKSVTVE